MARESHNEKEMIIGKVIFQISRKNDVHNNYETDYRVITVTHNYGTEYRIILQISSTTSNIMGKSDLTHFT